MAVPTLRAPLALGERAPELMLPAQNGIPVSFYERFCGRPTVVLIAHSPTDLAGWEMFPAPVFGILSEGDGTALPFPCLRDDGRLAQLYGGSRPSSGQVGAVVLDATMRVVDRFTHADLAHLSQLVTALSAHIQQDPIVTAAAPVLMVPQVLDPAFCQELISVHDADHFESGMMRLVAGQPQLVPDPTVKIRRDHRLEDPGLMAQLSDALTWRVLPAIQAAFHYRVTRFEAFKIVSYDAKTGGYFRRHRDNTTPDARHRRFALSINLNDGYDGGCLTFPEFGATCYRPPTGGSIIFSGSLLHEATDVTAGRRYVVLSFLWGEDVRS